MQIRYGCHILIICLALLGFQAFCSNSTAYSVIEQQLDELDKQLLSSTPKDNRVLNQTQKKLNAFLKVTEVCQKDLAQQLKTLQDNLNILPPKNFNLALNNRKQEYTRRYQILYGDSQYCGFLAKKINYMKQRIDQQIEVNMFDFIRIKDPNVIEIIKMSLHTPIWPVWSKFISSESWLRFNAFKDISFKNLWLLYEFIFGLWLIQQIFPKNKYLKKINMNRVFFLMGFMFICNPFIYQYLKEDFTQGIEVLRIISERWHLKIMYFVSIYVFLSFTFKRIERKDVVKLGMLLLMFFFNFRALGLSTRLKANDIPSFYIHFTEIIDIFFLHAFFLFLMIVFYQALKKYFSQKLRRRLSSAFLIFIGSNLCLAFFGYLNLSYWLMLNTIMSLSVLAVSFGYYRLVSLIFNAFYDEKKILGRLVKKVIHLKPGQTIIELNVVKYSLIFGGLVRLSLFSSTIWLSSPRVFNHLVYLLRQPQKMFGLTIELVSFLQGLSLFAFLIFSSRIVAFYIADFYYEDLNIKDQIERLMFAILIILSSMISLSTAGISFDRILIIAGALTVGIGFGLRVLVTNFVSGIMLMFYHPISRGDHILINGISGHVKKINIMGTILENEDNIDVIIPNSDILSKTLINFSLSGGATHPFFIHLRFSFSQLFDVEQAKKVILACVEDSSEIMHTDKFKPEILFLASTQTGVAFQLDLICSPKHFEDEKKIKSELNELILKTLLDKKLSVVLGATNVSQLNEGHLNHADD